VLIDNGIIGSTVVIELVEAPLPLLVVLVEAAAKFIERVLEIVIHHTTGSLEASEMVVRKRAI
jgi:hypothetical protein